MIEVSRYRTRARVSKELPKIEGGLTAQDTHSFIGIFPRRALGNPSKNG